MFQDFCTRVARKLKRLGYAKEAATRIAKSCYLLMLTACGLMGLFFIIPQELFEPITGAGTMQADARPGLFSSAVSASRR